MRLRVMVSIDGAASVRGTIDYIQPTWEKLGDWSVEVQDCDEVYFRQEMVGLDIDAGFLAWTGRALPISLTRPIVAEPATGGPSTLVMQGMGDLTLTRHIDIETGVDRLAQASAGDQP